MSKVRIDTPWGTTLSPTDKLPIATITMCLTQLVEFKKAGKGAAHIDKDIEGYHKLLESKSVKNCRTFMEVKNDAIRKRNRFSDNLAIIQHMKEKELWDDSKSS
jgi:hypothetical protein